MALSVGTIETYSTELNQIQYSDLGTQGSDSLTLSDSNLWLVDSTSLNGLDTSALNLDGSLSLYSDGNGYVAPVSSTSMESTTGDIAVYGSDPNADSVLYTNTSSPQTSGDISLLEVGGVTQSGSSLTSSSGELSSSSTNSDFTLASSGSTTGGTNSGAALALPSSGDPTASSDPASGITTETTIAANSVSGGNLAPSTDIEAVPLEIHSALGLVIIAAVIILRRSRGWRRRQAINVELNQVQYSGGELRSKCSL
ncbi:hypothetical protein [Nodosilinea nodulosa]|uniref:hypothetical protein n=1 Tax=Nodosilinea nodulosa TaxID=416001 RepID=UPI0003826E4B|nr:hypothetical protein [Nodosilinea nodulosa]